MTGGTGGSRHGEYNGWCRVEGIPLKAKDCPECVDAQIDALHGPGAAAALDRAFADGSLFDTPGNTE